jgi:dihydroorotate dehydrogenase
LNNPRVPWIHCPWCKSERRLISTSRSSLQTPQRRCNSAAIQKALRRETSRRYASTATQKTAAASNGLRNTLLGLATVLFASAGYIYITDTRASFHRYVAVPVLRFIYPDAEDAHHAGVELLKMLYNAGLYPRERGNIDADDLLTVEVFGQTLQNPIGISAGLDKDGQIPDALFALGASIVEIGGITPRPQPGNPKPRVWRIPSQEAMLNRYGLNSSGAVAVARALRKRVLHFAESIGLGMGYESAQAVLDGTANVPPGSLQNGKLLAVQIAKQKDTPEQDFAAVAADYVSCVQELGLYADILVVNVSSPNTPGLRTLQRAEPLQHILTSVVNAAQAVPRQNRTPAVMVKVSPDESGPEDIAGICEAVWASGVDGVIVANTTRRRPVSHPNLLTISEAATMSEQGGYSGPALFDTTLSLVRRYREALDAPLREMARAGREQKDRPEAKVIFASGGISSGEDALRVCAAGASVAMAYTALTYQGVGFVTDAKREMRRRIAEAMAKERKP